jgi:hypothetical protein
MVNQMRPPSTTWVTLVSLTAVIYTANAIWAVNAHLRRTVQGPAHFPTGRPRSVPYVACAHATRPLAVPSTDAVTSPASRARLAGQYVRFRTAATVTTGP